MAEVLDFPRSEGAFATCDDMVAAADTALMATRKLCSFTDDSDPAVRYTAAAMLTAILRQAAPDIARSQSFSQPTNRVLRFGRRVETRLSHIEHSISARLPLPGAGDIRAWTYIGLAITAAAGVFLAGGFFLLAAVLLVVRIVGSLAADRTVDPQHDAGLHGRMVTQRWEVRRCLAGHLRDALLLLAIAYRLMWSGHSAWAWGVCAVAILGLGATILRLSSWQYGLPMRRLEVERFLRDGGILLALALAGVAQVFGGGSSWASVPFLALAGVGVLGYTVIEVLRVHWNVGELVRREATLAADTQDNRVYVLDLNGGIRLAPLAI
jgi:hypothetical protein